MQFYFGEKIKKYCLLVAKHYIYTSAGEENGFCLHSYLAILRNRMLLNGWNRWNRMDISFRMDETGGFASKLTRTYAQTLKFWQEEIKTFEWIPVNSLRSCFVGNIQKDFLNERHYTFYWNSVTMFTFRRWKSVDENGLRCVTKEKYSLALHYKQFTAWFLRDIWHKYCSWYFKMVLNIIHGSGSWYQGQF